MFWWITAKCGMRNDAMCRCPQKFFQGDQSRHFLILLGLQTMQCKSGFTKRFTFSHKKSPCGGSHKICMNFISINIQMSCDNIHDIASADFQINDVTTTFFNTVHLLPKDLRFEHGGAKLGSCPGRHLTTRYAPALHRRSQGAMPPNF